jgi:hypothetical protein
MFISKKKLNSIKNDAYMEGYNEGYETCRADIAIAHISEIDRIVIPKLDEESIQKYIKACKAALENGETKIYVGE